MSGSPRFSVALWSASTTPTEKSCGVESAFPMVSFPSLSRTTQSVKVPPMSTPMMYSMSTFPRPHCHAAS